MSQSYFIGRELELTSLNDLLVKKTSSLVVIKGRRRIGKSTLIQEFAKNTTFYQFSGLAPAPRITAQNQRDEFAFQLNQQTQTPNVGADDWSKLFFLLAEKCKTGRIIVLFDEITWMASGDPTFLSKLKTAWDIYFKKNPKFILILCGSISAWIEKNIVNNTGYFGRISLSLTLNELSLIESNELLKKVGFKRSVAEKLIYLSVTGGVPWYIEQVNPKYFAVDNIKNLCFSQNGLLLNEYQHIFHDLFGKRNLIYQKITTVLASGDMEYDALAEKLQYAKSSALSDYLNELILSGYVIDYSSWQLKTGKPSSKLKKYRLADNFLRFYFRYMKSKLAATKKGNFANISVANLPGWGAMLGIQFENLVLKNRALLYQALAINPQDIVADGPYFQRHTHRQKGCQIDYLIQTKYNTMFVCEIKFSQNSVGTEVISEMKEKINRLSMPRNYAAVPILIVANKALESVYEEDFFMKVIDFSEYCQN